MSTARDRAHRAIEEAAKLDKMLEAAEQLQGYDYDRRVTVEGAKALLHYFVLRPHVPMPSATIDDISFTCSPRPRG